MLGRHASIAYAHAQLGWQAVAEQLVCNHTCLCCYVPAWQYGHSARAIVVLCRLLQLPCSAASINHSPPAKHDKNFAVVAVQAWLGMWSTQLKSCHQACLRWIKYPV